MREMPLTVPRHAIVVRVFRLMNHWIIDDAPLQRKTGIYEVFDQE